MTTKLRQYIKMLVEVAVSGEQALSSGLAMYCKHTGKNITYVLYDPNELMVVTKEPGFLSMRFPQSLDQIVIGYLVAKIHSGDCHNALEVKKSAAAKGFGPLMYDVAMSDSDGGLMPDRVNTSDPAEQLWKHYATKRSGEVVMKPLDNVDDPQTPEKEDDCEMVNDPNRVLNYAYVGAGQSAAKAKLVQRHDETMSHLEEMGLKRKSVEFIIDSMGAGFFAKKYG